MPGWYRIARYPFELAIHPQAPRELGSMLDEVLGAFRLTQPPDEPLIGGFDSFSYETRFGILTSEAGPCYHRVELHLTPMGEAAAPLDVVYKFEPEIVNQAIRESPVHLWIHGACLIHDDELVLLIAHTGTGKTTLSLGLLHHGYRLLTDDVILIEPATRQFVPVPRCPKYRDPALDHLSAIGFDLGQEARMLGRYVLLPPHYFHMEPIARPVRRVFFLQRDDSPPGLHDLSYTDGLLALMPHSNLLAIDPDLDLAASLFANTMFSTLNLGHYADDLARIVG